MNKIGNQFISDQYKSPLSSIFDAWGARGIKKAQDAMPSPLTNAMPRWIGAEQVRGNDIAQGEWDWFDKQVEEGDDSKIMELLFGASLRRRRLVDSLNQNSLLREILAPSSSIKKLLGGL